MAVVCCFYFTQVMLFLQKLHWSPLQSLFLLMVFLAIVLLSWKQPEKLKIMFSET